RRPAGETETELLVFEPRDFEKGLQVPAGTVEPGEELCAALWREIAEESGLTNLALIGSVATHLRKWPGGRELRHFFHLEAPSGLPDGWSHTVTAGEEDMGMVFVYRWLSLADAASQLIN